VLNLGRNQGVRVGDVFTVKRKKQVMGEVKVDTLYDVMSTAVAAAGTNIKKIKEQDKVVKKE
jgi:hypothetical protein